MNDEAVLPRRDDGVGVIALVPDRWRDIVMPRHQVVQRLARHFPTVWVEPPENWRVYLNPTGKHFLHGDRWHEPMPGMEVLEPGLMHCQVHRPAWLARFTFRLRLESARRRLLERGARRIVLYLWRDEFAPALDLVAHDLSCYHIDDEYSFDERDLPTAPREQELLRRVDQVIVHSPALMVKKGGVNPRTVEIPNGVDYAAFAAPVPEPADIAAIPHPRVGYAGVIKKQLDLGLIARLARARPGCSFVMVGPVLNVSGKEQALAELKSLPNVHFLGGKKAAQLPAYIQRFDVCLMCYEVNDYTKYIYPLKLNEYLATGRPTITAAIDAVKGFGSVVDIARDDAQWLAAIDQGLSPEGAAEAAVARRRAFAKENDWDVLVERVADWFRDGLRHKGLAA